MRKGLSKSRYIVLNQIVSVYLEAKVKKEKFYTLEHKKVLKDLGERVRAVSDKQDLGDDSEFA